MEISLNDPELIRRMEQGDEEAFGQVYARHHRPLYGFALHMSGSTATAEEAIQDVFMVLIRQPDKFDSERGTLRSFLYGVTRNVVRRHLERRGPLGTSSQEPEPVDDAPTPLAVLARNERVSSIRATVLTLPERYREVVILCDLQECSYQQAARTIGCSEGTVRSRLHRGRGLLRQKLRPQLESGGAMGNARPAEGIL